MDQSHPQSPSSTAIRVMFVYALFSQYFLSGFVGPVDLIKWAIPVFLHWRPTEEQNQRPSHRAWWVWSVTQALAVSWPGKMSFRFCSHVTRSFYHTILQELPPLLQRSCRKLQQIRASVEQWEMFPWFTSDPDPGYQCASGEQVESWLMLWPWTVCLNQQVMSSFHLRSCCLFLVSIAALL